MSQRSDTVHRFEDEVFFGLQRRADIFQGGYDLFFQHMDSFFH